MKKMLTKTSLLFVAIIALSACNKRKVSPTEVSVIDPVRHYYPVALGDVLMLHYELENVGKEPLVITEIQPSCGCVVEDGEDKRHVIFPGKKKQFHFGFYSGRNLGHVRHTIRIYGNIKPNGMLPLEFEVNVVPPSLNTPDYEEFYLQRMREQEMTGHVINEAVNGNAQEREGYVVDNKQLERWQKRNKIQDNMDSFNVF